jgi:hypothetical protein
VNNLSKKLVVTIAFLVMATKGKAHTPAPGQIDEDKVNSIISEIMENAESRPEMLSRLLPMQKSELEEAMNTDLTNDEFVAIQGLLAKLSSEGVTVEPTSPGKIVIATQEYSAK